MISRLYNLLLLVIMFDTEDSVILNSIKQNNFTLSYTKHVLLSGLTQKILA